jgi:Undecaprenyl-phosphate glucose phosphotransferase
MRKTGQKLTFLLLLADIFALNISIHVSVFLKYGFLLYNDETNLIFLIYNTLYILTVLIYDKNLILKRRNAQQRVIFQLKSSLLFVSIISILVLLLKLTQLPRSILFGSVLAFFGLRIIFGYILFRIIAFLRSKGRSLKNLVILGANGNSESIQTYCDKHQHLGYNIVSIIPVEFDDSSHAVDATSIKTQLVSILEGQVVNELIINLPMSESKLISEIIDIADNFGKRVRLIPDYYKVLGEGYKTGFFADIPVINIREIPLDNIIQSVIKRTYDVIFSILVIVILLPVFVIISFLIKLTSRGPILFMPLRVGLNGKTFKMYKFRSMFVDETADFDSRSTIKNDPRITPLGRVLRRFSLDELPQFMNVLLGHMSVVGPRPHRVWLNNKLKKEVHNYMVRHYLRPGITGWAQVNGWRGPTATREEKVERTKHDIWYLENWSFLLDVRIVFLTVFGAKVKSQAF